MKALRAVHHYKGQSLLEVVFALAIIILVVLALVQIVSGAIRSNDFSQKSSQATAYCQEAMEKVRAYRDKNSWTTFTTSCALSGNSRLSAFGLTTPALPAGFRLDLDSCLDPNGANTQRQVTVSVHWTDSTGDHESKLISNFSNWK